VIKVNVPFVDLGTQYRKLETEILTGIKGVCEPSSFILGSEVQTFEKAFAEYCGTRYCIGVSSGCDALLIALLACGIGCGDEVITAANTYIATALAISMAGATPVLVDCDEYYQINVNSIERAITDNTRAVMPVHLYGHPAHMHAVMDIADRYNLNVIEDAAQAHGAMYHSRRCGSMGDAGCFSFYPGKNLGAYGDGGAVVTDNPEIAEFACRYRNYGQTKKYHHAIRGWNCRLDTLQAAVLNCKLQYLDEWNEMRRNHARRYCDQLKGLPVKCPVEQKECRHIYHLFVIQTEQRNALSAYLKDKEISCGIHYPIPVHLQTAYSDSGYGRGDFPVTEQFSERILSLPMFPELADDQIDYICESIRSFFEQ
jgi:dTDP-4-amino-4,6-dideoxygalactose transaminase